jgi:hypothetical protein
VDHIITVEFLLQLVQARRHTGVVLGTPINEIKGFKDAQTVRLFLRDGKLLACEMLNYNGNVILSGEEVMYHIRDINLNWTIQTSKSTVLLPAVSVRSPQQDTGPQLLIGPLSTPANAIPYRVKDIGYDYFHSLPRRHQQVYALTNNTYSLQKIADLLHLNIDTVFSIVLDLQREGVLRLQ